MQRAFASLCLFTAITFSACECAKTPTDEPLRPEGVPCEADDQCDTGLCDALPGGEKLCLRECVAGCVEKEVCTQLGVDRYGCAPERAGLCQTCASDADCPYPADRCIALGAAKFCARDCSFDSKCPDSFRCAEATTFDGNLVPSQCQPKSGTCECTALTGGQTVPCEQKNSFGTCTGKQTCLPTATYSECTAHVPAAESCNGVDDDCNGKIDEDMGETSCGIGACARTVSNCTEGQATACVEGPKSNEICDELDNDCDGVTDNGFDKNSSLVHCGECNHACAPPFSVPVCQDGVCKIASCLPGHYDHDHQVGNGCEYACAPTGVELCDGLDNDCDGTTDEGFNLNSDPNNCGACGLVCTAPFAASMQCVAKVCKIGTCNAGRADCNQIYSDGCEINTNGDLAHCGGCGLVCDPPHATPTCGSGTCGIVSCDTGYDNCDTLIPNGCEIDTRVDVNHCGACNNACSFPFADARCAASSCAFTCQANHWDLDGVASNGCEYACTFVSSTDLPDLAFVDANCDGIDGEAGNAIYVAPPAAGGSDGNPGTRAQPKATVAAGMAAAVAGSKRDVYVGVGSYVGAVSPGANKGLYGGYESTHWTRSLSNVATVSGANPVLSIDGADGAVVQLLTLAGSNASGSAATAYGAKVKDSTGVLLQGLTLSSGDGSVGDHGASGAPGGAGEPGEKGQSGCEDSSGACDSCEVPIPGNGGGSACGMTGGTGGVPAKGNADGVAGGTGVGGTPGGAGTPKNQGDWSPSSEYWGANGANGANGSAGSSGSGFGVLSSDGYAPALSGNGAAGGNGKGGGGGGGGGGGTQFCNSYGAAGAGGGGGGCGGGGGGKGVSGGASIALYIWNSSVTVSACSLTSGNGAKGGNGAGGGGAGGGGAGGKHVNTSGSIAGNIFGSDGNQDDGSNSGPGGKGGNGGVGGAGGAGGGGPTVGVVVGGGGSYNPVATTLSTGTAGAGGSSTAGAGAPGLKADTYP